MSIQNRKLLLVGPILFSLTAMIAASMPMCADAIVQGAVFQNPDTTDFTQGHTIYNSPVNIGSPVSDTITWNFTCSTCTGYGITASGAAKVINGAMGSESSITITGSPTGPHYLGEGDSYSQYQDSLTITGGTGSGVLELQYALDGSFSSTGTGPNLSFGYLAIFGAVGAYFRVDSGALTSGQQFTFSGNGTRNNTVTFYVPFTYGTPLNIEPIIRSAADFYADYDSPPYTATTDFYNTATLNAALVLDGSANAPGSVVSGTTIASTTGLAYTPNGIAATVPEPATWLLSLPAICGLLLFRRRRPARASVR